MGRRIVRACRCNSNKQHFASRLAILLWEQVLAGRSIRHSRPTCRFTEYTAFRNRVSALVLGWMDMRSLAVLLVRQDFVG